MKKRLTKIILISLAGIILIAGGLTAYHEFKREFAYAAFPLIVFSDVKPSEKETPKQHHNRFESKIWIHRTNTPSKLRHYYDDYAGFEMDVNFNMKTGKYNVDHNKIDGNASLDDMFKGLKDPSVKFFWIDFKNLSAENKDAALASLNGTVEKYGLAKSRFVVESPDPEHLTGFAEAGYLTSAYFPYFSPYDNPEKVKEIIQETIRRFEASNTTYVSGDLRYINYLTYYFPKARKMYQSFHPSPDRSNKFAIEHGMAEVLLNKDTRWGRLKYKIKQFFFG